MAGTRYSTISSTARLRSFVALALRIVRSARAVRPCLPMTLPRSVCATRSSITVTRSPSTSMTRPSRGARESATTTRYRGRLFEPSRLSRMATATLSPPRHRKAAQALQLAQSAFHRFELLHHLLELCELLEQPVDVLHIRAAAARDAR